MKASLKFLIILLSLLFIALISTLACASLNKESELIDILIEPRDTSILLDRTQQFVAIAAYSDGSTANISDRVTWESSDTNVATIESLGLARAKSLGITQISASLEDVQGTTSLVISETPVTGPPAIPAGHAPSNCEACHEKGIGGAPQWPSNPKHIAAWNCKSCHPSTGGEVTLARIPNPHPTGGCATCHAPVITGVPQWPSTHPALDMASLGLVCASCHNVAAAGSSTLPKIPAIHPKEDCATCHATGTAGLERWPVSHTEQWPCKSCHETATGGITPPKIPAGHALVSCSSCHTDNRTPKDCQLCHATGQMGAPQWPASHVQNWDCKSCHQQG